MVKGVREGVDVDAGVTNRGLVGKLYDCVCAGF